jgi:hypothetical protein
LIKRLNSEGSFFLIHVDERQDYLYRDLVRLTAGQPNIRMASKRQVGTVPYAIPVQYQK